jgi:hypothetical protein
MAADLNELIALGLTLTGATLAKTYYAFQSAALEVSDGVRHKEHKGPNDGQ